MRAPKLLDALPAHVRNAWARHREVTVSIADCRREEIEALDPELLAEAEALAAQREEWRAAIEAEWRPETRSEARARRRSELYSPP
jgi:hypothetical protein